MRIRLSAESVHNELVHRVEEYSGQDLLACYQCGKCAAGCPVASPLLAVSYGEFSGGEVFPLAETCTEGAPPVSV